MIPATGHIRILSEMLMHQFKEMRCGEVDIVVVDDRCPWVTIWGQSGRERIVERLHACVSHLGEEFDAVIRFPIEFRETGSDVDVFGGNAEVEEVFSHDEGDYLAAACGASEAEPSERTRRKGEEVIRENAWVGAGTDVCSER